MFSKKIVSSALLLTALIAVSSCSGKKEKTGFVKEQPVAVTLAAVSAANTQAILASGQVEAAQTAAISTRMMGRITQVFVKAGDKVRKGQLLVTISDEDMKAKRAQAGAVIAEAEAAYAAAQKDYERFNNLFKEQSATAKELDNVTLQYNAARERVNAAKQMRNEVSAMLAYSSLTAPFAGVVTQKLAETGGIASPGMPLLTIEQNGILQVSAAVAESDISQLKLGDIAHLQIKSTGKTMQGKIMQLNPSSQFTGGQYIVKISIADTDKEGLYAGMFVSVNIPLKENVKPVNGDIVLVPVSAIVNREELTGIYTVSNNNTALLRWIRLGKNYGDKVEVLSGLSKEEQFIASAEGKLYNGASVRVVGKE